MRRTISTLAIAALALTATTVPAVATPAGPSPSATSETDATRTAPSSAKKSRTIDARKLVGKLKVTSERSATKYQRSKFPHWIDADGDGCDTRREVLIEEARKPVKVGRGCWVDKGRWTSYFDNKKHTRAKALDIDHLVPLAEAWRSGASTWDARTRKAFANDLGYAPALVAVTSAVNRKKGDKDPASWLPKRNECRYVSEWVAVKYRWGLSIDKDERKTIRRTLADCAKSQRLVPKPTRAKVGKETSKPKTPNKPAPDVKVKAFKNCTDLLGTYRNGVARSNAAAKGLKRKPFVHAKLYEANKKMDRDKDGVACEQG